MIRIGVSGAGAWGQNLLRNVDANEATELVAVCDPDAAARKRVAARYTDAKVYEAFECMLGDRRLDAVIVASPPCFHFDQAKKAIDAGLHVLVEKPMCKLRKEAQELVRLADGAGRVLMAGHTFLYSNLVHEVKRCIDSGELGDVMYIHSQRLNLGRVRRDVDAMWNFAPHDISITCYLLDAWPQRVNARGASFIQRADDIADVAFFQMDFADGRMMGGHVSWLDPQKVRRMVIVGSEKMLVYDDVDSLRHIQVYDKSVEVEFQSTAKNFPDFRTRIRAGDLRIPTIGLVEPLGVEISHFAECIETGAAPRSDGRNGLHVVCVLEAMAESMVKGGAVVEVDYGGTVVQPQLCEAS
ncbi:MAG: Gfo/Idh/MocA family oxidoreductase [Planctomycetes bacterium]|nr:Gfo/Idh/MocA family oxidoreductase [Planctomycetota bacterium]